MNGNVKTVNYKVVVIRQSADLGKWDRRLEYGPYANKEHALITAREHKAAGCFDVWLTSDQGITEGKYFFEEYID